MEVTQPSREGMVTPSSRMLNAGENILGQQMKSKLRGFNESRMKHYNTKGKEYLKRQTPDPTTVLEWQ